MFIPSEGVSPSANLMEVKASEAQGRHREVRSDRKRGTHVRADAQKLDTRRFGRTSEREITKSISIQGPPAYNPAVVHRTAYELTPGGLRAVSGGCRSTLGLREQQWSPIAPQESAEGIVRCFQALKACTRWSGQ